MVICQIKTPKHRHYPNGIWVSVAADTKEDAMLYVARIYGCALSELTLRDEGLKQQAIIYSTVKA